MVDKRSICFNDSGVVPRSQTRDKHRGRPAIFPLHTRANRAKSFVEEQSIVILDFGSQYTQLIARRIRELKVFSAVLPCTATLDEIRKYRPVGIILSGGPSSVYDDDAPKADERVLSLGLPVLGVCYGLHFITHKLGGKVVPGPKREYGHAEVTVSAPSRLFEKMPAKLSVWMSHGDEAKELPPGFTVVAGSHNALAAFQDEARRIWAVQFHPEVHHTKQGIDLLRNFVIGICGARGDWTSQHFIDETLRHVDATERFLTKLAGVSEPEKKRKIIGNEFIEVFDEQAHCIEREIGPVDWLVQGTLYPDVIESVSVRGPSQTIKTHHNVGGLPEKMKLKLIEPLKDLFKDEVRRIGRELGMPAEVLQRQPFPGPGLAVRILGEVTPAP